MTLCILRPRRLICSLGAVGALLAGAADRAVAQTVDQTQPPAQAAPEDQGEAPPPRAWTIVPRAVVQESVTDNVLLTPTNRKVDLINQFGPGLNLQGESRRVNASLDAEADFYRYLNTPSQNGHIINLTGLATAEVVRDDVFVDLRSAIGAEPINRNGPSSGQDRTLTANQTQIYNNVFSPYFRHEFGDFGGTELRYRLSAADFGSTAGGSTSTAVQPANSLTNEFIGNVHSGSSFTRFKWSGDTDLSKSDYPANRSLEQTTTVLASEYWMIPEAALTAKVGEDSTKDTSAGGQNVANPSWRLGVHLTPGPRTDFSAEGGQRYGGPYWTAKLDYKVASQLELTAAHDTTVTTQQQQLNTALANAGGIALGQGQIGNPSLGIAPINPNQSPFSFVSQPFTQQTNVVTLTGVRGRTTLTVSAEYDERDIGAVAANQSPSEKQTVAQFSAVAVRQLTPESEATLQISLSRQYDSISANNDTIGQAGLGYNYRFSQTLRGSVGYRYYNLRDRLGTAYQENLGYVGLTKTF